METKSEAVVPDRVLIYKETGEGALHLHLFLPREWTPADRRSALLLFHGGGFSHGSPRQMFAHAEYFAGRGLVAISAEYRVRDPHRTTPEKSHTDSRSAIRYVRAHATDLGVDPGRILAGGSSAGANLAMALGLLSSHDDPQDAVTVSCRPQAVLAWAPCPDLRDRGFRWKGTPDESRGDELALSLSLTQHLVAGCPPTLVLQGTKDVYLEKTRHFVRQSLALGNRIELLTAADAPHSFHAASPWLQATLIAADRFLESLGYVDGAPSMKPAAEPAELVRELPLSA